LAVKKTFLTKETITDRKEYFKEIIKTFKRGFEQKKSSSIQEV